MHALAVSSSARRPDEAVLDLARQLHERGFRRGETGGAALVFSSVHHAQDPQALSHALVDLLGPLPFLGWVGASAFHGLALPESQPGLSLLLLDGAHGYVRSARQEGFGSHVAAALAADAPVGRARFLAAPGHGIDPAGLLSSLDEQAAPLAGAVCLAPGGTLGAALAPDVGEPPSAALLSIANCQMLVGVAQGARPLGPARRITRARGNLVQTLDGRPALDALLDDLPDRLRAKLAGLAGTLFAGIASDDGATFVMRSVLGLDPQGGAVALAGEPKGGGELLFALRDARAARADLEATLYSLTETLGERRPLAALLFTCVARDEALLGAPLYDVGRVDDLLGRVDCPVVGIAGGGEFCTYGASSHLFHHTAVVALLLEETA